jgi:Co/Zn/Cd efflux system component
MSASCHHEASNTPASGTYRNILWMALLLNFGMFFVEIIAGLQSGSASLLADAIDFLGDGLNYALSLFVLGLAAVWGSRLAYAKAISMLLFGFGVIAQVIWNYSQGVVPEPATMTTVGLLALAVNLGVAAMLYTWREGNANMRSVWLCTRNDALGNMAILAAAAGVFGTGAAWPDWAVAVFMAALSIYSGWQVLGLARSELKSQQPTAVQPAQSCCHGDKHADHA